MSRKILDFIVNGFFLAGAGGGYTRGRNAWVQIRS